MEAALHFLIVDDDPDIRALLRMALRADCRSIRSIREASDGRQALEVLRTSAVPLIVLLDWQMPRLDGRGVLRAVAAEPQLQLAMMHRFVLITANDVEGDGEITTLLRELQVPVIRKPFNLKTVFAVVDDIIAR